MPNQKSLKKVFILAAVFLLVFLVLAARLTWLDLVRSQSLTVMAQAQRSKKIDYYQYSRGDFFDCLGRRLTGIESTCLTLFPGMINDEEKLALELAEALNMPQTAVLARIQSNLKQSSLPFILKTNLSQKEADLLREKQIPGVFLLPLAARYGPNLPAVHLLGFASIESPGVYRGRSGLEKHYDELLAGRVSPQAIALVDDRGRQIPGLGFSLLPPAEDKEDLSANVYLTLNLDYQEILEQCLAPYSGAAVLLDPENGDILALASSPKIDPYLLEVPREGDAYINKAFALYPPASTFKVVLAMADLEMGNQAPADFFCEGFLTLPGDRLLNCWDKKGHGREDLKWALANSCNPYFANLSLLLGGPAIRRYFNICGLDQQVVGGYPLPQRVYLDFNDQVSGDIVNVAVGENGVQLSPLMVAQLYAIIANGGKRVFPRLLLRLEDSNGQVEYPIREPQRVIKEETAAYLSEALRLAVTGGTGHNLQDMTIKSSGKTGTSQHKGVWFAGYSPAEAPRFVLVVYVENGGSGGREAAEVFRNTIERIALLD
ncbi:MAG: penicillin-binding protein 2 [Clostridiales bacterium]|nr:penicillin-binding protein 2 [Clostridiales bacterium]